MSTITVENILQQIDQLLPFEQSRLARLPEERRAERAPQPAKEPRDKRLPDQVLLHFIAGAEEPPFMGI
jgi:hypothetical protein